MRHWLSYDEFFRSSDSDIRIHNVLSTECRSAVSGQARLAGGTALAAAAHSVGRGGVAGERDHALRVVVRVDVHRRRPIWPLPCTMQDFRTGPPTKE